MHGMQSDLTAMVKENDDNYKAKFKIRTKSNEE